jgi:hypothetical protein
MDQSAAKMKDESYQIARATVCLLAEFECFFAVNQRALLAPI